MGGTTWRIRSFAWYRRARSQAISAALSACSRGPKRPILFARRFSLLLCRDAIIAFKHLVAPRLSDCCFFVLRRGPRPPAQPPALREQDFCVAYVCRAQRSRDPVR